MKDTFGMALMAYFDDPTTIHILEREDGNLRLVETKSYFRPVSEWHPIEQELGDLAAGRVLDVGCGSGRVMKYLEMKGLDAVGIDISTLAIEASKRFGVKNCVLMNVMDMDFPDNHFDSVLLLGNGLGLIGLEGSREMLKHLHRVTKPDGVILASCRDPRITTNPNHFKYHQRNRELGKPIGLINFRVNFNEIHGDWFELYMIEPENVEGFVSGTGWRLERLIPAEDPTHAIYGVVLRKS